MKKTFILSLFTLFIILCAGAQEKKTWDFSKGWSDETIANLQADTQNWSVDYNSDGSIKTFSEKTKLTGEFEANGVPIKELVGLSRGTAGLSKSNNYLLTSKSLRLTRNKSQINFPKLKGGQTITIVGRSANSTAENRGIKASFDYMVRIEGPEDNLIKASLGTVTNKWKIEGDANTEYDVQFTMITGGVDFSLFMIDDGDAIPNTNIAYLYAGSMEADVAFNLLKARENTTVTAIDVASEAVTAAGLQEYTLTVIDTSIPAGNAAVAVVKEAMPWTPILNLNSNMYAAWTYGTAIESQPLGVVKDAKSATLKGTTIMESDGIMFIELASSLIPTIVLDNYFAGDAIPLKEVDKDGAEGNGAVLHLHNEKHNGYAYLPYVSDVNTEWTTIFGNTVTLLSESKSDITNAAVPVISQEFKDKNTNVMITAGRQLPKTRFFYTTDGSIPTAESKEYTEAVNITEPCTFKAVAIAEGYTLSDVAELAIEIHEQPQTPIISTEEAEGHTTITLTCETADADIWYNFSNAGNDTLKSSKYTEPFICTMPQDITVFAISGGKVYSELVQQRILVRNPRIVIDVVAHFEAKQWSADNNPAGISITNGQGVFSWGKSATSMWTDTGTEIVEVDPETGDEVVVVKHHPDSIRPIESVAEPGENPQWVLKSRGTCLLWQSLNPTNINFGDNEGAYNPIHTTDVDTLFAVTKYNIQFYKFQANEGCNASIETLNRYQSPLDVIVLANMAGGPLLVQVSADGDNWTTIGEIAKTGYSRLWNKNIVSYDRSDEVYVRVTQEAESSGAKVFDIYIANQGEKSQTLLKELNEEYTTGIENVNIRESKLPTGIYTVSGTRVNKLQRGLNIIVGQDGMTRKVVVK